MKTSGFVYVLRISVATFLLAGCGGSQSPIGAPGAMPQTASIASGRTAAGRNTKLAWSYRVLHRFSMIKRYYGASKPFGGLLNVNGTLYGTTFMGGGSHLCYQANQYGCGTVYSLSTSGGFAKLYRFLGGTADGAYPVAGLVDVNGTLYGTTSGGVNYCVGSPGGVGCGTVYSITTSGSEKVLYSFQGGSDGESPLDDPIDVNGTLYGTTEAGGGCGAEDSGCGTVYSVTTGGSERVLYRFGLHGHAGIFPSSGLVDVNGTLYGTTSDFGLCTFCGTAYSITTSGQLKVLYSFGGATGAIPQGLINVKGTLYGTTYRGGKHDLGTVYRLSTSGKEKVLHSFGGGSDGKYPNGGLIYSKGTLYGTTQSGGSGCAGHACGTVFSVTTSATEQVLYSFTGGADGAQPDAPLIMLNGILYGSTMGGGLDGCQNCGVIFALSP